jgi:hypothetical protein
VMRIPPRALGGAPRVRHVVPHGAAWHLREDARAERAERWAPGAETASAECGYNGGGGSGSGRYGTRHPHNR